MKYRLGDICTITKGETGIMKAIPGAYTMVALGEANKTHNEFQFDTKAVIIPLVSSTGHGHASMKRVKYQEGKFALGNILCAVIPKDENFVLAKYLHIYLHWNREELLVSQMKGMANVSLSIGKIAEVIVTVPSLEKQRQIVELEQKLVAKELIVEKLLTNQLTQLENLNQAILQEAVQGKIVPQNPSDEPASELLKRIKSEKLKSGKKEKPLPPIKPEEIPFEIPKSWVWCRFEEISESRLGKMLDGFKNQGDYHPYLRNLNVRWHDFNLEDVLQMKFEKNELEEYSVKRGDLLICEGGYPGRAAIWKSDDEFYKFQKALHRVRFFENISARFYLYYLDLICSTDKIRDYFTGSGIQHLTGKSLKQMPVPLPPLSEQNRIVAEIEKQLAKTKQLKAHIIANQQATEQLLKALLHGAFEVKEKENIEFR